jgi:hypothetical protein
VRFMSSIRLAVQVEMTRWNAGHMSLRRSRRAAFPDRRD